GGYGLGSQTESGKEISMTNYAACHAGTETPIDVENTGVMFLNSGIRFEQIHDGLTYTIFVGEKPREKDSLGWMSGTRSSLRNTGSLVKIDSRTGRASEQQPEGAEPDLLHVGGFGSWHEGGLHVAMGDGSVRFLSENIDRSVLGQLGNRSDGELMQPF
ncbi:MAG: DUF1559 domain-containing protein, partial [Planctomycetaceae bacterium]|nr:DUF1559 domain-containing protein [Planctomycetaceae bacterium]